MLLIVVIHEARESQMLEDINFDSLVVCASMDEASDAIEAFEKTLGASLRRYTISAVTRDRFPESVS